MSDRGYVRLTDVYDALNDYFIARIARGVNLPVVYNDIYNALKDVPTSDTRPSTHGRWETEVFTHNGKKNVLSACSVCGQYANDEYSFCPNCGADMRLEEDE